jgi:hypothetical protein
MPLERIYTLGGLDLRSNELLKAPNAATEADNVDLDANRALRKRKGYDLHTAEAGFIQLIEYHARQSYPDPALEYNLLGVKADGLYGYSEFSSAWVKIPFVGGKYNDGADQDTWVNWSVPLSVADYDGTLYLADPSGTVQIMKFDGLTICRAGVPKPKVNNVVMGTGTAGTYYVRVFLEFEDFQFSPIVGDYHEMVVTSSGFSFDIIDLEKTAFKNYLYPLDRSNRFVKTYISNNPTFGYRLAESYLIPTGYAPTPPYPAPTPISITVLNTQADPALAGNTALMTDIYDYTVAKRLPPKAKYLSVFGNMLVAGNFEENDEATYEPLGTAGEVDAIRWSDLSTGGTVEAFPTLNSEKVGESNTKVTGLSGASDNLIAFKDTNVFYLSGTLVNGNYRFRDSLSEGIGCVSHNSLHKIEGGIWFMSIKGLYIAKNGYKPTEFSDVIEPLFSRSDLDLTKSTAILDAKNEKILCYIHSTTANHLVVVFDYYHKEWFTYSGIDASGGIAMVDNVLYHSDGTNVYERSATFNDNGAAISCTYSTSWFNQQIASLKKKFTRGLIFSIGGKSFDLNIKSQSNWKDVDKVSINKRVDNLAAGSMDFQLSAIQAKALRLKFSNATLNEDIEINGYEYQWEHTQQAFKGDD